MLEGAGLKTGVDLTNLIYAGQTVCNALGRSNNSKVSNAYGPVDLVQEENSKGVE